MYAMQHGVVGHTVEFPLNPRCTALTEEERHDRTRVNTAIALAPRWRATSATSTRSATTCSPTSSSSTAAASPVSRPARSATSTRSSRRLRAVVNEFDGDTVVNHCNSNTYPQDFPRAWVIPAGEDQRSATAAVRDGAVPARQRRRRPRATADVTIGGETYPAGTFVVDMHQAKRGMANNALETGRNLSDDWRAMYGDAAWSIGALYGATLVDVAGRRPGHRPV